mmetsp:Transcript_62334/g.150927  ORF Transcript_62334/g.150927 Transcript_62334/m.150927 type:complete len:249 (+) Transcript_62334:391-1137(+)
MRAACVCACWPIGDAATATFFTPVTVSSHGIEGLARCCITAAIGVVRLELRGACTRPAAEELRCFAGVPLLMVVVVAVLLLLLLLLLPFAADAERRALPRGADFVATGRSDGPGCMAAAATATDEKPAAAATPLATASTAGGTTAAGTCCGACSVLSTWTRVTLLSSRSGTGSCRLPSWSPPAKAANATTAAASVPAQRAPAEMVFAAADSRRGVDGKGCEGETPLLIVPVRGPDPTLEFGVRYCWVN